MSFKVTNKKLWKKYTKIWGKVSNLMNKEFDSEHVYGENNKYKKKKIKIYGDNINTNFYVKKYQKKKLHVNVFHY